MRAAQVGDVEALDADRRHIEPERELQALERLNATLAAALAAQLLLLEGQAGIALGQLEDPALLPALGRAQLHRPVAAARQRSRQRGAPGELALDDEQRGDR